MSSTMEHANILGSLAGGNMAGLSKLISTLFCASLLFPGTAPAMTIEKFDHLAISDQGDYVALMLTGVQKILADEGRNDELARFKKLFGEVRPGDQMSIGMLIFESNVDRARLFDAKRYAKDHNVRRLEVEDAVIVSLKKEGIVLSPAFMHVGDNFRPKLPPRN